MVTIKGAISYQEMVLRMLVSDLYNSPLVVMHTAACEDWSYGQSLRTFKAEGSNDKELVCEYVEL